jgi:hypothetical protein
LSRPSEPILQWFRKILKDKDLNVASLAKECDLPRQQVRKALSGKEPMTLDQLILFSDALGLSQEDLAISNLPSPAALDMAITEAAAPLDGPQVDPWGNQPEQLFRIAFSLGCNFFFLTRPEQLADSGVPSSILDRYTDTPLPIKLDAAYHAHNNPRYEKAGVTLTLSFDALYDCFFPWSSIIQVVFFPATPSEDDHDEPSQEEPKPKGPPHLRLVT